ncbi:VOC family protein [Naumannella huperziae]
MQIDWISAFVDVPAAAHQRAAGFWCAVTGGELSPARGDHGQFATIEPAQGDAYLRVQNTGTGGLGVHLDLQVADRSAAVSRAVELGGREHTDYGDVLVMTSPGGMRFCLVEPAGAAVAPPARDWGGHSSAVDQVCIDIAPELHEAESAFWAGLTGWAHTPGRVRPEFSRLASPDQPLQLLLQRLDEPTPLTRAHLDLGCSDVEAETARHLRLGAKLVRRTEHWTVLTAPGGHEYCLTDRPPRVG